MPPVFAGGDGERRVFTDVRFVDQSERHLARLVGCTPSGEAIDVFQQGGFVGHTEDDEEVRVVDPLTGQVRVLHCELEGRMSCLSGLQARWEITSHHDVQVVVFAWGFGLGLALMLIGHGSEP